MAKAIHNAGELKHHRRINGAVVTREHINRWQELATKLFKDQMLILHLVTEASRLEQPLTVPLQGTDRGGCGGNSQHRYGEPLVQQGQIVCSQEFGLDRLDQTIVLRVENIMDRRQGDVFVTTAIPGDVMQVQQLVVVEAVGRRSGGGIDHGIDISGLTG